MEQRETKRSGGGMKRVLPAQVEVRCSTPCLIARDINAAIDRNAVGAVLDGKLWSQVPFNHRSACTRGIMLQDQFFHSGRASIRQFAEHLCAMEK